MTAALAHRGPDDAAFFEDEHVALGFRRLAVIDLATGQQPIRLEGDRAVIVLNGEIYNFRELRRELRRAGVPHPGRRRGGAAAARPRKASGRSRASTACSPSRSGSRDRRRLTLARDRFGIKPLFVCSQGDTLAFASELGALLAGGFPASRRLDRRELRHFLAQRYLSPGGCGVEGVRSLPPGDGAGGRPATARRSMPTGHPRPSRDAPRSPRPRTRWRRCCRARSRASSWPTCRWACSCPAASTPAPSRRSPRGSSPAPCAPSRSGLPAPVR